MSRSRHNTKEYEQILRSLEGQGWAVWEGGNGHYRAHCPNDCKCRKSLPSSPSDMQSLTKNITQLKNHTCWEKDL